MRRVGMVVLGVVVVLVGLWLSLMWHFPGESVSNYVSAKANQAMGFDLVLSPAEFHWNRVQVDRAEIHRRDRPQDPPLFVLTEFAIPITWKLLQGLPANALIGTDGRVEAFLPWSVGEDAWLEGEIFLEQVPLPAVVQPINLKGDLRVSGTFKMDEAARAGRQLPQGTLQGSMTALRVAGVKVGATELPPTQLEDVRMNLSTGRTVQVQQFEFKGDIQGEASGTLIPNMRVPRSSPLNVRVTAAFRNSWLAGLGALRPIVESFLERGRMTVNLGGTVANPRMRAERGARQ